MTTEKDRERALAAVRARLARAFEQQDEQALFGPAADADVGALLQSIDPATDMEGRHAAGWLFFGRAAVLPAGQGGGEGAAAGMLLFPVWVADPSAAPEELAANFATTDPRERPDPAHADGPAEWSALCAAGAIAVEGQQHAPPVDTSEQARQIYAFAARLADSGQSRQQLLWTAVGAGLLACLATPELDPRHPGRAGDLAHALSLTDRSWPVREGPPLGDAAPDGTALDSAIRLTHHAIKRTPADSPDRITALANLGLRLSVRYERSYDLEDLYEAIGIARDVLAQLPEDHADFARHLSNLAYRLQLRLRREGGEPAEYDEVVHLFRRAVTGDPNGRGPALANVGAVLTERHGRVGRRADLDEAVAVLTEALELGKDDPWQRRSALNPLGLALYTRHKLTGGRADLDAAIRCLSEAAATAGEVTAGTARHLGNLALALHSRYELTDGTADLDEAVSLLRRAAAVLPAGHPERPGTLNNLGRMLNSRTERTRDVEELAEAVRVLRETVDTSEKGHPALGGRLLNLSTALNLRYQVAGDSADLHESLNCRRRAVALTGTGPEDHTALLSSKGLALVHSSERVADPATALTEAVGLLREAVQLTADESPLLPRRRLNLAIALVARLVHSYDLADVREARSLVDAALAALPDDSPMLPNVLATAAAVRTVSPSAIWSRRAQDEAIELLRRAADATPPGHADRTRRLTYLANTLLQYRGRRAGRRGRSGLREAADIFRTAALEQRGAPSERLQAAREWGTIWARLGRPDLALEGFTVAVDLLPSVAPRHLVRDDQEFVLSETTGLGASAAACAVRCGRPGLAVRLLEQARGVLLSHAFDAAGDLTRLRAVAPELAARFERLRETLDSATAGEQLPEDRPLDPGPDGGAIPALSTRADLRHQVADEWRELTSTIRAEHPELQLFRPVREWAESELRATACDGPVVLVNVSEFGSDALVVTASAIEAVPLPGLTPPEVARYEKAFQDAVRRLDDPRTTTKESLRAQEEVRDTLAWLWRQVTGPVLDHLGIRHDPHGPWPRLWWSPGGTLSSLPLHAASPADGSPGALDRAVSSYTPTLRALHHARDLSTRPAGTGTLVVAVTEADGLPPLPAARAEAEQLGRLLPTATVLSGESATHTAVVSALSRHAYAHFACHAQGDLQRPSGNRLVLHDHAERPLTVRDLARLRLPSVRLAYLSACDTLRTTPELADEAVHIVSAFQMAGFPHVVGSLWHVDDTIGARVAEDVYGALHTGNGRLDVARTAEALHTTVRALRGTYPATPSLWACQVHAGP
ncbi:CHAT domain-containing protein [Streptomyces albicerus]|uniref:CHAT domain-containing protein n=1 Tax=Streptomyces albicerus TaxID=2569859 RepID=UPI00124B49D9|nr:CHAT domain-containing protein [Streptomyces albicerus]